MKINCKNCGQSVDALISKQTFIGGEHIRADCPICGKWIKWLAKDSFVISKEVVAPPKFMRPTLESIIAKTK